MAATPAIRCGLACDATHARLRTAARKGQEPEECFSNLGFLLFGLSDRRSIRLK